MGGVGQGVEQCTRQATCHGIIEEGAHVTYTAPVLEDGDTAVPALYGLDPMAERNTYVGTTPWVLHQVPEGREHEIVWPEGTTTLTCKKSRSGHWLLPISRWDTTEIPSSKVTEAFAVSP